LTLERPLLYGPGMRISAALAILLMAACGGVGATGGDGGSPASAEQCQDLRAQFDSLVSPPMNRACAVDADCVWIPDGCFDQPLCATFVNTQVAADARDLVTRAQTLCTCAACAAQEAACNQGVCGLKAH
jgi:hypothetical protein